MEDKEKLTLSGLQHFAFCRRQWALIFIEQQWQENLRTAEGNAMHHRAHDETQFERRGDMLTVRGLRVFSERLNRCVRRGGIPSIGRGRSIVWTGRNMDAVSG